MLAFSARGWRLRKVGSMRAAFLRQKTQAIYWHGEHPECRITEQEGGRGRGVAHLVSTQRPPRSELGVTPLGAAETRAETFVDGECLVLRDDECWAQDSMKRPRSAAGSFGDAFYGLTVFSVADAASSIFAKAKTAIRR